MRPGPERLRAAGRRAGARRPRPGSERFPEPDLVPRAWLLFAAVWAMTPTVTQNLSRHTQHSCHAYAGLLGDHVEFRLPVVTELKSRWHES